MHIELPDSRSSRYRAWSVVSDTVERVSDRLRVRIIELDEEEKRLRRALGDLDRGGPRPTRRRAAKAEASAPASVATSSSPPPRRTPRQPSRRSPS